MITGIHHVALTVTDLDAARAFYGEAMGFEQLDRPDFDFPGAWFGAGAHQVHLIVAEQPAAATPAHVAFAVADFDAACARLERAGVQVRRPTGGLPGTGRQAFVRDPSGNRIELNGGG